MEIRINGQAADITPESEKTVGEILASLDMWLTDLGHSISGLSIDGKAADTTRMDEIFSMETSGVKVLDIYTSSTAQLSAAALLNLLGDIDEFEELKFEDKSNFVNSWKQRAQANFIKENMPELYSIYIDLFSKGGVSCQTLRSITEERLREVRHPVDEFSKIEALVNETCVRLVDLPLDIQTGKDGRAAQTIQIFSGITEKILRITKQLNLQGYLDKSDEKTLTKLINDFSGMLRELLDAYERRDSVLVGDLSEYEAAPKLQELFASILKKSREAEIQVDK
jgi:ribosome-associated translation inhibitor RaiA